MMRRYARRRWLSYFQNFQDHRPYFTVEQAIFGLAGFTSMRRSLGETTRSMSSIGIGQSLNLNRPLVGIARIGQGNRCHDKPRVQIMAFAGSAGQLGTVEWVPLIPPPLKSS